MIKEEIQDLVLWAKSSVNKYLHSSICSMAVLVHLKSYYSKAEAAQCK